MAINKYQADLRFFKAQHKFKLNKKLFMWQMLMNSILSRDDVFSINLLRYLDVDLIAIKN